MTGVMRTALILLATILTVTGHASAQVHTARSLLDYGAKGDTEARITCAFTADMVHDLITRLSA